MQRMTITLDDELVEEFEQFLQAKGYANRSEAIRDLIRDRLDRQRLDQHPGGDCIATLSYVYNHHQRELASRLTQAHHDHHDLSVSTMHVHLDHDNCLETVVLNGKTSEIQAFANDVISQPGVRHGKLYLVPAKQETASHAHGEHGHSHRHQHTKPIS